MKNKLKIYDLVRITSGDFAGMIGRIEAPFDEEWDFYNIKFLYKYKNYVGCSALRSNIKNISNLESFI